MHERPPYALRTSGLLVNTRRILSAVTCTCARLTSAGQKGDRSQVVVMRGCVGVRVGEKCTCVFAVAGASHTTSGARTGPVSVLSISWPFGFLRFSLLLLLLGFWTTSSRVLALVRACEGRGAAGVMAGVSVLDFERCSRIAVTNMVLAWLRADAASCALTRQSTEDLHDS